MCSHSNGLCAVPLCELQKLHRHGLWNEMNPAMSPGATDTPKVPSKGIDEPAMSPGAIDIPQRSPPKVYS